MKKIILICLVMMGSYGYAQKIAYVDTKYILENIPDYKLAQDQLDELSKKWQKEIETELTNIDKLYKAFQAESVLLPEDVKKKREDEIVKKERDLNALKKKRFGQDGDLFKKREELVKPIQDRIYKAIEDICNEKNYSIVFDKASGPTILYASPKIDISDLVLEKLGFSANKTKNIPGNKTTTEE